MNTHNLSEHLNKLTELKAYLSRLNGLVVAFSGGVDSTFLTAVASQVLGDKCIAVTASSPYIPDWEIEEARKFTRENGIKHHVIELAIPDNIKNNPPDRCYLCKGQLFGEIIKYARDNCINDIADGSNADDTKDYRPGMKALKELEVRSPLLDVGLTKTEIRLLSKELELPTWNRPAYACLLTRLPYDTKVEEEALQTIEKAEVYLMGLGFHGCRVRTHGTLARIELNPVHFQLLLKDHTRDIISKRLKEFGYEYVTIDIDGYKTGSFNDSITK